MRYFLENKYLIAEFDSFGAELKSVKSKQTNQEYMWNADPTYWGRTSPILFPFVGSLKNKEYTYRNQTYSMNQHGFARDMEHSLKSKNESKITFSLSSTPETMLKYPFPFVLEISYLLENKTLSVHWNVSNPATEKMFFSIGAHPAFCCPIGQDASKNGYQIYFDGLDEVHHHGNTTDTGLALREDLILPLENHRATITDTFFDRCTYMMEQKQTGRVALCTPDGTPYVTVDFDTPLFAIWSPEGKNAPFVCIEPWYGRCDATDFEGDLQAREFTNVLNPNEEFKAQYQIHFS